VPRNCKQTLLTLFKLQAAFDAKKLSDMREWMTLLIKRRGQQKQVIIAMINLTYNELLPKITNRDE